MAQREVQVSADHIERASQCRPERALEELIWNGLDAGGPSVEVVFGRNDLGGISFIEVRDHGTGVYFDDLERAFGYVGYSLKIERRNTPDGRAFHGSEGRGRFRSVVVLGSRVTWFTTFEHEGQYFSYNIVMDRANLRAFDPSDPVPATAHAAGTTVRVDNIDKDKKVLLSEAARRQLTQRLALYLHRYPVTVYYDGAPLDARACVRSMYPIQLERNPGSFVDIVEWSFDHAARELFICDIDGFTRHEMSLPGLPKSLNLSVFVRCPEARAWAQSGEFELNELSPAMKALVGEVKEVVRDYVRQRLANEAHDLVEQWKEEKIYPFSDSEPATKIQAAERQAFDIIASQVHLHHPTFRETPLSMKKLTLHLVRQALETNPSSLQKILAEVVQLPKAQQDELAQLFDRTSLEKIVAAAKAVDERLRIIRMFEGILFEREWKKKLRERTQLHRLLVHHLWIFGEEYLLDSDDEPMRTVLQQHLRLLGRSEMAPEPDVEKITAEILIPDLMLSRSFERDREREEHLVIELKRPSEALDHEHFTQIKKYAYAVVDDDRFNKSEVSWMFVLVGNRLSSFAKRDLEGNGLPYGCIAQSPGVEIWVKEWNEVLRNASKRYAFYKSKLELEASLDDGLALLEARHSDLISGKGLTKKQEREKEGGVS